MRYVYVYNMVTLRTMHNLIFERVLGCWGVWGGFVGCWRHEVGDDRHTDAQNVCRCCSPESEQPAARLEGERVRDRLAKVRLCVLHLLYAKGLNLIWCTFFTEPYLVYLFYCTFFVYTLVGSSCDVQYAASMASAICTRYARCGECTSPMQCRRMS